MDRNFYYQKRAQEHQREISKELTTRQLLNDANANPLATKRLKQIALRTVPATIVIITLLWLYFSG